MRSSDELLRMFLAARKPQRPQRRARKVDVELPLAEPDWAARRSPSGPQDQALTRVAQAWLDGLPRAARPLRLAAARPRIVNRLALCWADARLTDRVFDGLLVDRRGGRRGFPAGEHAELVQLHRLHRRRDDAAQAPSHGAATHDS